MDLTFGLTEPVHWKMIGMNFNQALAQEALVGLSKSKTNGLEEKSASRKQTPSGWKSLQ